MTPDKLFLDANILFSLCYGSRGLGRLLETARTGQCRLMVSLYVLEEVRRNLDEPEHLLELENLTRMLEIVPEADPSLECPVDLPDKDRPIFMAAAAAGADYLITGDMTHFGRHFHQTFLGVTICMARHYLSP